MLNFIKIEVYFNSNNCLLKIRGFKDEETKTEKNRKS
jgi:hypothetical protein